MSSADILFARNMKFAGDVEYDLKRVHGPDVALTLHKISDNLMIDAQSLSVCLRATVAFHEDEGKVLLANVPQRGKSINEFTLLITTMGTGKSFIFSKIMETHQLKRQYDLKIEHNHTTEGGTISEKNSTYRHAILNEITGPGLTKYLDSAGNIFVLIDEFDGDNQKIGLFCAETKSNNINSSAAGVLKSFHSGMPFYQKGKVSDNGYIKNPQVSFLAASNGAPILDILRAKMKSSVIADAMVMRTLFDVIDSPPKFNSNFKDKLLTPDAIGLEILLLASSLLSNQTYEFDTEGSPSADKILQDWQDMCFASSDRWKNIDRWTSGRFAKTSELTARLAAQLAHINIAFGLLQDFIIEIGLANANGPVSFDTYRKMMTFFHEKFPPYSEKSITISIDHVEAAIYVTKISLLKFFNLFNLNIQTASPIDEIPWIPPSSNIHSNLAVVPIPATQHSGALEQTNTTDLDLYHTILKYPSICFTFTQLVSKYAKLKYRYKSLESILDELINKNLLTKVKDGLRSGRNICDLYIKSLPQSITLNTVNTFITDNLDPIKMPWTLYKSSCERVLLPSHTSVLSNEIRELFKQTNYSKMIERYETDIQKPRNKTKSSGSTSQHQQQLNSYDNKTKSLLNGNTSPPLSPNENVLENEMQKENEEEQTEQHILQEKLNSSSESINNTSSIIINPSVVEISSLSSSPTSIINPLLPRPPCQILRTSSVGNINSMFQQLVPNTQLNSDNLPGDNEECEPTFASSPETNQETEVNVRRSGRSRTKNKRLSSPEPTQHTTTTTHKKKKK